MYIKFFLVLILKKLVHYFSLNSKICEAINYILIILIGSNHPRRITNLKKIIKKNALLDYEIISFKTLTPFNNFNKMSIFVGDSHSEFYGRNFNQNRNKNKIFLTYHTGPTLMSSFGVSSIIIKRIYNLIVFFKKYNFNKNIKINIIFSFGEIDVRNFYYQILKIDKSFKSDKLLTKFIVDSFIENFLFLKKMLKNKNIGNIKFYFKDITPTTYKKSHNPTNIKELEKIRKDNLFPVIGKLKERVYWRKILSKKIESQCKKKEITFIKLNKKNFAKSGCINKLKTFDNGHISDLDLLNDIQLKVK
jgi:hypothetical protein